MSSLAQHLIPMQHASIYRAWLPSEIFPKDGNSVEWEKTIENRLRRATKRASFPITTLENKIDVYSPTNTSYTAISRKIVGKNVHATIPKVICDMINTRSLTL